MCESHPGLEAHRGSSHPARASCDHDLKPSPHDVTFHTWHFLFF